MAAKKTIHYGEGTCWRDKDRARAICNCLIRGYFSGGDFVTDMDKVTCKSCLKIIGGGKQ